MALYFIGQFMGWAGSFSLSQSTSNWGSVVPVVPADATRWPGEVADVREGCAVKVLPRASVSAGTSSEELDSAMESASCAIGSSLLSVHFWESGGDMSVAIKLGWYPAD